ncbi:MAG: hypothetical protein ACRDBG_25440, partial [Waterburya sp.]
FNTGFTKAILLFMSYLANREEETPNRDVQVTTGNVDLTKVAKTYTHLLTRLHNTSPRTKKLFPIQQLIEPAKEVLTEENKKSKPIDVVPDESISEVKETTQEMEPLADTQSVKTINKK